MRILFFVFLVFIIVNVRGQTDSILTKVSKSEQIEKGRKLLLDEVLHGNDTGSMHYVTVGFGGFGRRLKRDR